MLEQLNFYLNHSFNDLRVNPQRTFFALLCIASGVAAIVSLQTLAGMIGTTLTGNLQESNRADIRINYANSPFISDEAQAALDEGTLANSGASFFGQPVPDLRLSAQGLEVLQAWTDTTYPGQLTVTYRQPITNPISLFLGSGTGSALTAVESGVTIEQVSPVVVDSRIYPLYGAVNSLDGVALADMIQNPTDIVITEDIARALDVNVGAQLRINGSTSDFTVTGIVDSGEEVRNPATDAFLALFGYYYLDHSAVPLFDDVIIGGDIVYVQVAPELDVEAIAAGLNTRYPYAEVTTTEALRQDYEDISEAINQLVTVMGLISLLIGGIGIINTMQVIVRRRTLEIAVLKTMGLQANQITLLFLVEALIMGVIGSVAGVVVGWGAVFFIRGAAEAVLATQLPFIIVPQAAVNGLIVGVLITAVFGFLPTLSAGQIRPALVLRPSDRIVPRAGFLSTLFALGFIILAVSLVAQTITGSFSLALSITVGAFVFAGFLYLQLSLMIWLIGRFLPSFGLIDLRISLRQMLAERRRAAITLLALVIGVFSLSLITLLSESITNLLRFSLEESAGGNLIITLSSQNQREQVEDLLLSFDGVNSFQINQSFSMQLESVTKADGSVQDLDSLNAIMEVNDADDVFGPPPNADFSFRQIDLLSSTLNTVGIRDVNAPASTEAFTFASGRDLSPSDSGQAVIVLTQNGLITDAELQVGDTVNYRFGSGAGLGALLGGSNDNESGESISFEIIGIRASQGFNTQGFEATVYAPADAFPEDQLPDAISVTADVDADEVSTLRRAINDIPGAFALETAAINRLISGLLETFTAFPSLVAALGLIVGGVVIANSVALTTIERRREIAVMKAVGLQRERVLGMLLLENGILGLIGGLIGVGIGLFGLVLITSLGGIPASTLPIGTALVLMTLCIIVALVAALTTAWGASNEKPLAVLRYE